MNGYDRYLAFQFRETEPFMTALFTAIAMADSENTRRLANGFPEEVEAYLTWTRKGAKVFLSRCSRDNPLVVRMCDEYPFSMDEIPWPKGEKKEVKAKVP